MKKTRLQLENLKVESFKTSLQREVKGGTDGDDTWTYVFPTMGSDCLTPDSRDVTICEGTTGLTIPSSQCI